MITNKTEGKARKGHRKQAYLKAAIYEIQHQVFRWTTPSKTAQQTNKPKEKQNLSKLPPVLLTDLYVP